MRSQSSRFVLGLLAVAGLATLWVIPSYATAPQVPGTLAQPGMTEARVWVNNRKPDESIPVHLVAGDSRLPPIPVAVAGTATVSISGLTPVVASRQTWEYRTLTVNADRDSAAQLSSLGADGWEAVGLTTQSSGNVTVLLKRPR